MEHSFDIYVAGKVGVHAAIIYNNISHWVNKNIANDRHFYDGYYWTYNSIKAFEELFPYMSGKQIILSVKKLEENGFIKTGNYNQSPYDRTKWYCDLHQKTSNKANEPILPNRQIDFFEKSNENAQKVKCITDINTDSKPYIGKRKKSFFVPPTLEEVEAYFKEKGYSSRAAKTAFDFYEANDWKDSNNKEVKNWKQKMVGVWFKDDNKEKESTKETNQLSAFELMIPGN